MTSRCRLPIRPGEFHPEPLTEPDLILSHHPARAIARRLPPSAEPSDSSQHAGWSNFNGDDLPPSLPLREAQLHEVVSKPAALLSARFETPSLAASLARQTAEESTKDAGALPLLSYLLDDMWTQMVR